MTPAPNPSPGPGDRGEDLDAMHRALALGASVRNSTAPNPWVGALVSAGGRWYEGATEPPGGPPRRSGGPGRGGRPRRRRDPLHDPRALRPPRSDPALHRGHPGLGDHPGGGRCPRPRPPVSGRGVDELRRAGLEVVVGVASAEVTELLAPYLKHRRTGRPWVVLKLAATLDGRIAAPDGTSRWITGDEARADVHRLRAASDAVLVGAGTIRADDPELTVRPPSTDAGPGPADQSVRQPLRVVLGQAPPHARVLPALEMTGELDTVLDELGARGILQVLVEGGARVAHAFHRTGVVDRYVLYLAPALFGGDDALAMFSGPGAPSMEGIWRGRLVSVTKLGDDLRVELEAA